MVSNHSEEKAKPGECRVAIHQPNYWPWLGYFHKMAICDIFVLLDDVQLSRGKSFTSRVKIKTSSGPAWLTVPVQGKSESLNITEARIVADARWRKKHWKTIDVNYCKAPYFSEIAPRIEALYAGDVQSLFELNRSSIEIAKDLLGIKTRLAVSSELNVAGGGTEKLVETVASLNGNVYVTGEGAGSARYLEDSAFGARGITIQKQGFMHPVYSQLWGEFIPNLSILDLLFSAGPQSLAVLMGR
jgi:hypothetical protein